MYSTDENIIFTGKPFQKEVWGLGTIRIEPVVFERRIEFQYQYGFNLLHLSRGQKKDLLGMADSNIHTLIISWRVSELLRAVSRIDADGVECVKKAADWNCPYRESHSVISDVLEPVYRNIMFTPVPDVVVDSFLSHLGCGAVPEDISFISTEVEMGTVRWREGFKKYGIRDPSTN